jgi:hypothetical protein
VAHGDEGDDPGDGASLCRRVAERDLEALLAGRLAAAGRIQDDEKQECGPALQIDRTTSSEPNHSARRSHGPKERLMHG